MSVDHVDHVKFVANDQMAAAEAGDMDRLKSHYASDALFWSNLTGQIKGVEEQFAQVAAMRGKASNIQYVDIRVTPFADGFVQQHRAIGDLPNGSALNVHACFICTMRDGKIVRREEYLDSGQLAAVRG